MVTTRFHRAISLNIEKKGCVTNLKDLINTYFVTSGYGQKYFNNVKHRAFYNINTVDESLVGQKLQTRYQNIHYDMCTKAFLNW